MSRPKLADYNFNMALSLLRAFSVHNNFDKEQLVQVIRLLNYIFESFFRYFFLNNRHARAYMDANVYNQRSLTLV